MASIVKKLFGKSEAETKKFKYVEDESLSQTPFILSSLFYILVVIFVGVPVWFMTCTRTRHSLPDISNLERLLIDDQPRLHLDISIIKLTGHELPDFDDHVIYLRNNLPGRLETSVANVTYNINWRVRRATPDESRLFKSHPIENAFAEGQTRGALLKLEQDLLKIHRSVDKFRLFMYIVDESYYPAFCDPKRTHTYTLGFERFVYLCPSFAMSSKKDQKPIVNLVNQVLDEVYVNTIDPTKVKQILSSQTDLLFSLLPENIESSGLDNLQELSNKLVRIFAKNVKSQFADLAEIVNIKIITQNIVGLIDSHYIDTILDKSYKEPQQRETNATGTTQERVIRIPDLSKLFQMYISQVSEHSSQHVSRVLVIVPDTRRGTLSMTQSSRGQYNVLEGQDANSLLILQDDKSLVLGLRAIIRRLVGLSSVNLCHNCNARRDVFLNRWELDSIMGALTTLKLRGVHLSLKSLSDESTGLKIPRDISKMSKESNSLALEAIDHLGKKRTLEAYRLASQAFVLSETAYFDPSLIGQPNFPDELKYAIYLPLFFPLAIPIVKAIGILVKFVFSMGTDKQEKLKTS